MVEIIFIFFFGLAIGSFLNALIYRLHRGKSIGKGRSACPLCGKTLPWHDLVPVISFLVLHGKCRFCGKHISIQYPLVELACGLLFVFLFFQRSADFSWAPVSFHWMPLIRDWIIGSLLLGIFVFDFRYMEIPDHLTIPGIIMIAILNIIIGMSWFDIVTGGALGFSFFGLQYWISKGRWIGSGDIRLGALLGVLLGPGMLALAFFLSYISGSLTGLVLIIFQKKTLKSAMPFGTFLCVSGMAVLIFGSEIWQWYKNIIS